MPAEERKFKRRRMVAFIPFCRRERDEAESHAETTGVPAVGAEAEGAPSAAVGIEAAVVSGIFVSVGEGSGEAVSAAVLFGEGRGIRVEATTPVSVEVGMEARVAGNAPGVKEAGTVVGCAVMSVDMNLGD